MGREHEPTVGQWYEDLENDETFQVLKVDEDLRHPAGIQAVTNAFPRQSATTAFTLAE